jgi:hypothetical protein
MKKADKSGGGGAPRLRGRFAMPSRVTPGVSAALLDEVVRLLESRAPAADVDDFIRVIFRRQEPGPIPVPTKVLAYIAEHWRGAKREAGPPRLTPEQKTLRALDLVDHVEQLTSKFRSAGAKAPQQKAFEELAALKKQQNGQSPSATTLERRYRAALEELRGWPDFLASHPRRSRRADN